VKTLIAVILALVLCSACTSYTRRISIYVEDGGSLTIGDIEVLAEVTKGDEKLTNSPDISPAVEIPLK